MGSEWWKLTSGEPSHHIIVIQSSSLPVWPPPAPTPAHGQPHLVPTPRPTTTNHPTYAKSGPGNVFPAPRSLRLKTFTSACPDRPWLVARYRITSWIIMDTASPCTLADRTINRAAGLVIISWNQIRPTSYAGVHIIINQARAPWPYDLLACTGPIHYSRGNTVFRRLFSDELKTNTNLPV
jgi:hypothetical protein